MDASEFDARFEEMNQEQATAGDKSADAFREAQVGATFVLLQYALRGAEALGRRFEVDLDGLTENCMADELLCASYEEWIKTKMNTTMFTPGWMLVFTLGSQIMMTRNANIAMRNGQGVSADDSHFHSSSQGIYTPSTYSEPDYFTPMDDHDGLGGSESPVTGLSPATEPFQPIFPAIDEDPEETARVDALITESLSRTNGATSRKKRPLAIEKAPRKPRARKTNDARKTTRRKKKPSASQFLDIMAAESESEIIEKENDNDPDEGDETE